VEYTYDMAHLFLRPQGVSPDYVYARFIMQAKPYISKDVKEKSALHVYFIAFIFSICTECIPQLEIII